jgi:hypothetical protein
MSLDKAIIHKKEYRKQYRGAKAIDASCRNHGDDPWDRENRLYKNAKAKPAYDPNDDSDLDFKSRPRNEFPKETTNNYGTPHYAFDKKEYDELMASRKKFKEEWDKTHSK